MSLSSTKEIIAELRAGRMVILVDEEDRENEGDLVLAAEFVTPEAINFMAKHGRGLICLTLTEERCDQLNLPMMTTRNGTSYGTNFTVSIEAAEGVTTGISAADRSRTIEVAVARHAKPADIVQPGHIFPLRAHRGGVLMRAGHTEAGCDLAELAGLGLGALGGYYAHPQIGKAWDWTSGQLGQAQGWFDRQRAPAAPPAPAGQ
jgi:3,4-dihydroxy 2-butanone 4-phosphate synthase/GTP cyclohydrolase II